jgi:phosphatidylserine/phosphatidylglycerophosphate/cardiolipin synthase-like enzyme
LKINKINFIFCLLIFSLTIIYCNPPSTKNRDLLLWQIFLNPEISWKSFFSYPGRTTPQDKKENVLKEILNLINETEHELEIHAYGLTDPSIIDAIGSAKNRGIRIKVLGDSERNYDLLKEKHIPFSIWKGSGLHHIKVILSDSRRLFTGTGNFTTQGLLLDYDGYFSLRFPEKMGHEFQTFIREESTFPIHSWGPFHFYNSPNQGKIIQKRLLDSIRNSKRSIDYLIYSHADSVLTYELIRAAKRGVVIRGIYDRPISPEGIILGTILPRFGSRIYEEENEDRIDDGLFGLGGLNHHKTMIIDNEILFSGSYNYSSNARDSNRELFYETKDIAIIQDFIQEFERVKSSSRIYPASESEISDLLEKNMYILEWGSGLYRSLAVSDNTTGKSFSPISSGLLAGNRKTSNLPWIKEGIWDLRLNPQQTNTIENPLGIPNEPLPIVPILSIDTNHPEGSILSWDTQDSIKAIWIWTWESGWVSKNCVSIGLGSCLWKGSLPQGTDSSAWMVLEFSGITQWKASCFNRKGKVLSSEIRYLMEENQVQNRIQKGRVEGNCQTI